MKYNYFHSVVLKPERCIGCTYCLKICPTEAIRLKNGKADITPQRCIDCGECIRVCPNNAKNTITDDLQILKQFKYNIALTLPILFGQFSGDISPLKIMSALKSLGFDEVIDTSAGSDIVNITCKYAMKNYKSLPVINSSCPAILRLIQIRFPELLDNIIDIETPVEVTARIAKRKAAEKKGLSPDDIGVILITPCTARVTSIKNPLGIDKSYIDGTISMKDIYGLLLKAMYSSKLPEGNTDYSTQSGILWYTAGGQVKALGEENTLAVDGINNAITILEEIEMGKLEHLAFVEITACPGGCLGGPLTVENRFISLSMLNNIVKQSRIFSPSKDEIEQYINMYESGFIRLTHKIEPKAIMGLDQDMRKSIEKMENMQNIIKGLPGINCGICGAPTCQAFAEDIVMGHRERMECPIINIINR